MPLNSEYEGSERSRTKSISLAIERVRTSSIIITEIITGKRSSSTLGAGWNVLNIIQGIGILGIPYAIMKSGWIGIAITLISAFVCCSTGKMIIDCLYESFEGHNIKIKVHEDYPDVGAKVWPRFGHTFVSIISFIEMLGASTLYVILLGSSSFTLLQRVNQNITEQQWFLIGACVILLLLFFKKMSIISWFSLIALLGLFGTIASILSYCISKYSEMNIRNIYVISVKNLPVSTGIIVFSYCAHPVLPAIEGSMKNPKKFHKVMNVSFIVSTITKLLFGLIPVFIFGRSTFQTISNNILYSDLGFFISSLVFVIINVMFSMPLVIYLILDKLDQTLLPHFHPKLWSGEKYHFFWLLLSRVIAMSFILLIALVIPYFALVMAFIGSFTGTFLTFILPCWFSLALKGKELNIFQKIYRIGVIIIGSSIGLMGMIFSAIEMYNLAKSQ